MVGLARWPPPVGPSRAAWVPEFTGVAWLRHPTGAWGVRCGLRLACRSGMLRMPLAPGCFRVALPLAARFVRVLPGCWSLQAWPGSATPPALGGLSGVAVACHLACSGCPWPWVVSGWHCHSPPASCACRLGAGVDRPGLAPPPCRRLGGLRVRSPVACHLACSGCPWPRAVPGWHCHSPPGLRGGQCRVLLPVHQTSMMSALC